MEFINKGHIVEAGEKIISACEKEPDNLEILRAYNKWYTEALEFVVTQAQIRLSEFEDLHNKNQAILCKQPPDFKAVIQNCTIQISIIDGSTDHDFHFI